MAMKWERHHILEYILLVQQHTCLYSVKSVEYLDRNMKAQAFNQMLEQMKKCMPTITLDGIKKKWKNLRTQYMQEERLLFQSKKSGCGRNDVYVPKLWCYDQLAFLKSHINIRASEDNVSTSSGIESEVIVDGEVTTLSNSENTSPNISGLKTSISAETPEGKRPKRGGEMALFREEVLKFRSSIDNRKTTRIFDWLLKFISTQMEEVHPDDQTEVALKLQSHMLELKDNAARKRTATASTSRRDILQLSMDAAFDEFDLV